MTEEEETSEFYFWSYYVYEVFVKQKIQKRSVTHYCCVELLRQRLKQ